MKDRVVWKNYDATGRDLHVDVPMSRAIENYTTQGLVGDWIFPVVPVRKQTDMIPYFPLGEFIREVKTERSPGTHANIIKFAVGTMAYAAKNHALRFPLTIEDRANADDVWMVRESGSKLIVDGLRIKKEVRVFATVNSSTNVSTIFLPSSAWNASANYGNPYKQVVAILNQTQDLTGFRPNRILFGQAAWRAFKVNSFISGLLFPHGGGVPTLALAGGLFDAECRVAEGYYTTAGERAATVSLSKFFDDAVLAFFQPDGNALGPIPRYGATLRWQVPGVPSMAVEALPYDPQVKAEFQEVGVYDDEKVLDTRLCAIMKGVNSGQSGGITG